MTEQERIEGINSEQLATATDRVLLASRFGRARPSSPALYARGSSPHIDHTQYARGSSPHVDHESLARGSSTRIEHARGSSSRPFSHELYVPQTDAPLYAPKGDVPPYAPKGDAPYAPHAPSRASSPDIHRRASSGRNDEHTVFTRLPKHYQAAWKKIAAISLVTSLISAAAAIVVL